jgi:cobalamin biosynthesis protein CobT
MDKEAASVESDVFKLGRAVTAGIQNTGPKTTKKSIVLVDKANYNAKHVAKVGKNKKVVLMRDENEYIFDDNSDEQADTEYSWSDEGEESDEEDSDDDASDDEEESDDEGEESEGEDTEYYTPEQDVSYLISLTNTFIG